MQMRVSQCVCVCEWVGERWAPAVERRQMVKFTRSENDAIDKLYRLINLIKIITEERRSESHQNLHRKWMLEMEKAFREQRDEEKRLLMWESAVLPLQMCKGEEEEEKNDHRNDAWPGYVWAPISVAIIKKYLSLRIHRNLIILLGAGCWKTFDASFRSLENAFLERASYSLPNMAVADMGCEKSVQWNGFVVSQSQFMHRHQMHLQITHCGPGTDDASSQSLLLVHDWVWHHFLSRRYNRGKLHAFSHVCKLALGRIENRTPTVVHK